MNPMNMQCIATGYGYPSIEWFQNSPWMDTFWTKVEGANETWKNNTRDGVFEVTSTIEVTPNESTFRNIYKCYASNDVKSVASEPSEQFLFACVF